MRLTVQVDMFPDTGFEPDSAPDERYTPRHVFEPLDRAHRFTVDACATPESAKCPRFWTRADNGLEQPWTGERVWCNPPYSDITSWVHKAWAEMARGCELAVQLLPAWTDREWWELYVEPYRDGRRPPAEGVTLETRFLSGRVRFGMPGNPEGIGAGSPPFWCCLLVWKNNAVHEGKR